MGPVSLVVGFLLAMCSCASFASEVEGQVQRYWGKRLIGCGSRSFFAWLDFDNRVYRVIEYKDMTFSYEDDDLTPADKLNGYEHKVRTQLKWSACRVFSAGAAGLRLGGWSEWTENCIVQPSGIVEKKKGLWNYDGKDASSYDPFPAPLTQAEKNQRWPDFPTCEKIPR